MLNWTLLSMMNVLNPLVIITNLLMLDFKNNFMGMNCSKYFVDEGDQPPMGVIKEASMNQEVCVEKHVHKGKQFFMIGDIEFPTA